MEVNVNLLYKELKSLKKEVSKNNALFLSLIPEEKVNSKEFARLHGLKSEMVSGKAVPYSKNLF